MLFKNNNSRHNIYLHAEPERNENGQFINKHVTFKIFDVRNGQEVRVDAFDNEQLHEFYISRSDNRTVKMKISNKLKNGFDDVTIVF